MEQKALENVKIIIWGFGAMGSAMAEILLRKEGTEITGVCDNHPERTGKSMYRLLGKAPRDRDVIVQSSIEEAVRTCPADIALVATDSFIRGSFPKIKYLLEHGLNVISTAEEMAYPEAADSALAAELDGIARENGVSVLGTGINPGFIMDLLVVALTGVCADVESVSAERVNSLSPFGPTVMKEQGVGLSREAFEEGSKNGSIAGHVGFRQSISMIADAVGWELSAPVEQSQQPIISNVFRRSEYAEVAPGNVAGCRMEASGYVDGKKKIAMLHPQQIEPQAEGIETADVIRIQGEPSVNMEIRPEIPGGAGTAALCVNMIPQVINASPGLKTMLDLPVPRAVMGDMRLRIRREKA